MSTVETRGNVAASVVERFADLPAGSSRTVRGEELGSIEIAGRIVSVGVLFAGVVSALEAIIRLEDPELRLEPGLIGLRVRREESRS